MANAVYALRKVQFGWETTFGTAVAATKIFRGDATIRPIINRELEDYPTGIRADVAGGDITTWKGCEVDFETSLNYEEILYALQTGIVEDAAPTGAGPYVWTFPASVAATPTLKSLTMEAQYTDGAANHHIVKVAGLRTSEIEIVFAGQQRAMLRWKMFGKAAVLSGFTPTASLTVITGRAPVAASLFGVYFNPSWATVGATQKTGLVRAGTLTIQTGVVPAFTLDGSVNLDFTTTDYQSFTGSLSATMRLDANAGLEKDAWVAEPPTLRVIRLLADNGGAGAANKKIQLDLSGVYSEQPSFSRDGQVELMDAVLGLRYDTVGAKVFEANITNGLAALV